MFDFYTTEVDFSHRPQGGVHRVSFIMPNVPGLVKRKAYAIYKMPGCSEIMVSPEDDFYSMIASIDADVEELEKKKKHAKKREEAAKLDRDRISLLNQKNMLFANKFEFVYRGSGYSTPVCVTSIFLEEIGITAQNNKLYIAFNTSTGEIILHSKEDHWKYDYDEEDNTYRERRASIFRKYVG